MDNFLFTFFTVVIIAYIVITLVRYFKIKAMVDSIYGKTKVNDSFYRYNEDFEVEEALITKIQDGYVEFTLFPQNEQRREIFFDFIYFQEWKTKEEFELWS